MASRTMRYRLLISVPTAVVADVLVLEPADEMDVYIYGQLSGKAMDITLEESMIVSGSWRGCW